MDELGKQTLSLFSFSFFFSSLGAVKKLFEVECSPPELPKEGKMNQNVGSEWSKKMCGLGWRTQCLSIDVG